MASLTILKMRLAKAVASGDQVAMKRLQKQITAELQRRGK